MTDASPLDPARKQASERPSRSSPPVVGIGASAGGLRALEAFFSRLPADTGLALVVVSHHSPAEKSLLPEILSRSANVAVEEATDGVRLRPDRAYVAPPGRLMELAEGTLRFVVSSRPSTPPLAIDFFLRSLAQDAEERAAAVILSGTGTDGTLGVQAVKAGGGIVLVQEEASAEFPGMPASAIATGLADFVVPPEAMPGRLVAWMRGSRPRSPAGGEAADATGPDYERILGLLRARGDRDFSGYKPGTVLRRIERRQNLHQLASIADYARLLQENEAEVRALSKDILIGVTAFFRDAPAFEALREPLTDLLAGIPEYGVVRAWVPGCSTGEEAYSLAILVRECIEQLDRPLSAQIFATDVDPQAIETARGGSYPLDVATDISQQRLTRSFVEEGGLYQVRKEIREMLIFANQDVLADPPFTRVDIVSCRNLLIYLNGDLQRRVMSLFHYALNPGGLLLLGTSEATTGVDELFEPVDRSWKLYRRSQSTRSTPPAVIPSYRPAGRTHTAPSPRTSPAESAARLLARNYAPPSALVNGRGDVVHVHGRTGAFLEPAPGRASMNLLEMAREGLRPALSWLLREAARSPERSVEREVRVTVNGHARPARVVARQLAPPDPFAGLVLVSFEESSSVPDGGTAPPPTPARPPGAEASPSPPAAELEQVRSDLQATIEQLQSTNEELASSNEEVQATNEELQSANEELETSREEMQSLNEELQTVNAELRAKVDELSRASDDIENLLNSTSVAILFLDREFRIKRFNTDVERIVRIQPSDVGRPIRDLAVHIDPSDLHEKAELVLRTLVPQEIEVESDTGAGFLMRVSVYRTRQNVIDGVVLAFVDITRQKELEEAATSIVETVRQPLVTLDGDLIVQTANRAFCDLFRTSLSAVVGRPIFGLPDARWDVPRLRELLYEVIPQDTVVEDYELACDLPLRGERIVRVDARRMQRRGGRETLILLALTVDEMRPEHE